MTTQAPHAVQPDAPSRRRPAGARVWWLVAGLVLIGVLVLASFAFGARVVSLGDVISGLTGEVGTVSQAAVAARVPRTALALLVGMMLAVSGASMQAVTRNPLADPVILGVSFGASLAVVIGIAAFGMSDPAMFMLVSIAGAAGAAIFVYFIGSMGYGGTTPLKLALAGAATGAAFSSLIAAIMLPRVDILNTFQHWQIGGVGGATWDRIWITLPFFVVGTLVCFAIARGMNSLALGDDVAASLGEHVARTRLLGWAGSVILCGAAVAVAGPIGFVGLIVPHLCRLVFGPDYRWLLPASAIVGAALLLASDIVGRVIARPEEIDVGIVTAVIGAPFFVWIVRRQKVRAL